MSSSDQIDDHLNVESEDDHMDVPFGSILDDTNSIPDPTEQVPQGDEGAGFMEITQAEPAAAPTAEETSLQESVTADPKEASMTPEPEANIKAVDKPLTKEELDEQVIGDEAREKVDSMDDLDGYLDVVMLDQTMSIARPRRLETWLP